MARVTEISKSICASFAEDYRLAFHSTMIDAHEKKNHLKKSSYYLKLIDAPIPSLVIKKGILLKQGANVKSWKRRYFFALNKADNYSILYCEDESGKICRGRFSCCG